MKRAFFAALLLMALAALAATPSLAATYYVQPSGSDTGCTGLSSANYDGSGTGEACAWQTLSKVNSSVSATSSDVYLLQGNTYTIPSGTSYGFHIDWSGTSGDRAVVGTYYLDESSNPVVGYTTTRAKISGVGRTLPNAGWPNCYAVSLTGDYITIQDLEITESASVGVRLNSGADNNIVQRCYLHHNFGTAFIAYYALNAQVLNNLIHYNVYWDVQDHYTGTGPDWGGTCSGRAASGIVIRGNKLWNNWGEGISLFDNTDGFTIDQNVVYDTWGPQIYLDTGPHNGVISRNLVYRSQSTPTRWDSVISAYAPWHSILITVEGDQPYYLSNAIAGNFSNIDVWGNLVIGGERGIEVSAAAEYPYTNVKIYNNTVLEPYSNATRSVAVKMENTSSSEFKNNIVWQTSGNSATQAVFTSGVTRSNNAWSKAASVLDDDAEGTGDVYSFSGVTKTTGLAYTSLAPGSITGAEFALPAADNAAVNAGADLCPSGCSAGHEFNTLLNPLTIDLTVPTWATTTQSGTWDIGGLPYAATEAPPSGTGLPSGATYGWDLSGGDWTDDIGSLDATATGTVSQATSFKGTSNKAASIGAAGTGNRLATGNDSDIVCPFSLSFWFNLPTAPGNDARRMLLGKYASSNPIFRVTLNTYGSNDVLEFGTNAANDTALDGYATYTFSGAISTETWYHCAATCNSDGLLQVYVNKVGGTSKDLGGVYDVAAPIYLFSDGSLEGLRAVLDDPVIYNGKVLSTAEIESLYGLIDDFAEEATNPVPVLTVNSFGQGGYAIPLVGGTATIPLAWTITGATPSECGIWTGEGTETWLTDFSCSDNAYDLSITAIGLYDNIKFRTKASGGDYVYATIANPILVRYSSDEWVCGSSGCDDFAGAIAGNLGPVAGDTLQWDAGNADLSSASTWSQVNLSGSGSGTLTGRSGMTFYRGDWTPSSIPTMGNNVALGSRIWPLMNWSGTGGSIQENTLFLGTGTGLTVDLSGIDAVLESCYVLPERPRGTLTFTSVDPGPCLQACANTRACVNPEWQRAMMHLIGQ